VAIDGASLVEDPNGSVLLVGGQVDGGKVLDTILRLSSSEDKAWELLPQKLATPRYGHAAYFVPNSVADCN
jgi:hypothetical protein